LDKISFDLLRLVEEREAARADATARGDAGAARDISNRELQVEAVFEGDLSPLAAAGFPLRLLVPGLAGGHLNTSQIRALTEHPEVLAVRSPARLESLDDQNLLQIRTPEAEQHIFSVRGQHVPPPEQGGGVTVGVIDTGIFADLQSFKRNGGADTVISRLWDQTFRFDAAGEPVTNDASASPLKNTPADPTDETGARATRALGRTPKAVGLRPDLDYGIDFTAQQIDAALTRGGKLPVSLSEISSSGFSHGTGVSRIAVGNNSPIISAGVAPAATFIFVKRSPETGVQGLSDAINYIIDASRKEHPNQPIIINCSFGVVTEPRNGTGPTAVLLDATMADPNVAVVVGAGNDRDNNSHAAFSIDQGTSYFLYIYVWDKVPKLSLFFSYSTPATLRWRMAKLGGSYDTGKNPVDQSPSTLLGPAFGGHAFLFGKYIPATPFMSGDQHFVLEVQRSSKGVERGYWVIEIESDASSAPTIFVHAWRTSPAGHGNSAEFMPLDPFIARLTPTFPPFTPRLPTSKIQRGVSTPSPQDSLRPAVNLPHPLFPSISYVRDPRLEEWIQCTMTGTASAQKPIVVGAYDALKSPQLMTSFSAQGPDARFLAAGLNKGDPKPDIAAPGEGIDTVLAGNPPKVVVRKGTSYAAPYVTGVLALMWAAKPSLTNVQLKERLLKAAQLHPPTDPRFTTQPGGWVAHNPNVQKELWGAGMLDALDAAKEALKP